MCMNYFLSWQTPSFAPVTDSPTTQQPTRSPSKRPTTNPTLVSFIGDMTVSNLLWSMIPILFVHEWLLIDPNACTSNCLANYKAANQAAKSNSYTKSNIGELLGRPYGDWFLPMILVTWHTHRLLYVVTDPHFYTSNRFANYSAAHQVSE